MADLSKSQSRILQADRPTTRRSSIIPSRRDTDATQRRAAQDIRSGIRGDVGGAEALMDFARQVNGTADAFVERDKLVQNKNNRLDVIQGKKDLETGTTDPETFKESLAYQYTVTRGQAKVAVSNWVKRTKDDLTVFVNSLEDTDIELREEKINGFMRQRKNDLLLDEEGKVRDFGSPEAAYQLLDDLDVKSSELTEAALSDNRKNLEDQAINATSAGIMAALEMDEPLDFEKALSGLPKWVPIAKAREVLVDSVLAAADAFELNDPPDFARAAQIRRELADSVRMVSDKEELAPLVSDGGGLPSSTQSAPSAPTGKLPVSGQIMDNFEGHKARGSTPGLDIDAKMGDAIQAPAPGRVTKVGYNARAGHFIMVDHGNGVESSYSHLSAKDVKVGDQIASGQRIGAVGNSGRVRSKGGDGSHLHYVIRQNGKPVDPQSFRFTASAPATPVAAPGGTPKIDALMASGGVTEGEPAAAPQGSSRPRLVPILKGTVYSLSLEQRARVTAAIEAGETKAERYADQEEQKRYEKGAEEVINMYIAGNPPSSAKIKEYVDQDRIDPSFGWQMIQANIAAEERAERKLTQAEEKAERENDIRSSIALANEEINLRGGSGPQSPQEFTRYIDQKRRLGELGPEAKVGQNIGSLFAAWQAGKAKRLSNPSYKVYGDALIDLFKPKTGVAGVRGSGVDAGQLSAAQDEYQRLTDNGMSAREAFNTVRTKYVKPDTASAIQKVDADIKRLEAKAKGN